MQPISASKLFSGLWGTAPAGLVITDVVTDNREAVPGSVFVAIEGERADGHSFAADAVKRGAVAVMCTKPIADVPADICVQVPDILDGMIRLGANYRACYNPLVLGVTGSVGKTTTKEFCSAVFSAFDKTLATEGNQNNEIGMPKTLFRLDDSVRYAVIEMGMQALGEIHKLTMAVAPDAAIITKIGTAHIEALGSRENIRRAKLEICDGLASGAPLVMNGDDEMLRESTALPSHIRPVYVSLKDPTCDVFGTDIRREGAGQYFTIQDKQFGSYQTYVPTIGTHTVYDALLAYAAATRLGLNPAHTAASLSGYKPAGMRQKLVEHSGVTVIEDCYNANPDSMAAALAALGQLDVTGRRFAVLGDMLELGDISVSAHEALAGEAKQAGVAKLYTVGAFAALSAAKAREIGLDAQSFATNAEAAAALKAEARPGDAVLVKASRGMRFEEILAAFYA